jgi:hypothetical protein
VYSWLLLAKEHQRELLREAEQRRLIGQALAARRKRRASEGRLPAYRRAVVWLAGRLMAAGQTLERRYGTVPTWEMDVALEEPCC